MNAKVVEKSLWLATLRNILNSGKGSGRCKNHRDYHVMLNTSYLVRQVLMGMFASVSTGYCRLSGLNWGSRRLLPKANCCVANQLL